MATIMPFNHKDAGVIVIEETVKMRTHLALFAGLGGFITAGKRAGFKTVFANDFEKSCVKTLKETFPKIRVSETDVTKLSVEEELIGYSLSPCQSRVSQTALQEPPPPPLLQIKMAN